MRLPSQAEEESSCVLLRQGTGGNSPEMPEILESAGLAFDHAQIIACAMKTADLL